MATKKTATRAKPKPKPSIVTVKALKGFDAPGYSVKRFNPGAEYDLPATEAEDLTGRGLVSMAKASSA